MPLLKVQVAGRLHPEKFPAKYMYAKSRIAKESSSDLSISSDICALIPWKDLSLVLFRDVTSRSPDPITYHNISRHIRDVRCVLIQCLWILTNPDLVPLLLQNNK